MKKFTNNDIFYNTLLASPKYKIVFQSGSLRINDQINQNQEYSSSLNGIDYEGIYSFETYGGTYQYTSSISREFIYGQSLMSGKTFQPTYTEYSSILKVAVLKNSFKDYVLENEYADVNYYLVNNGVPLTKKVSNATIPASFILSPSNRINYYVNPTASINMLLIPKDFYGSYIKPGSLELNMYVSGVLTASAIDNKKDGKIYQTYGQGSGSIIGSIFYDHGIVLLTGSTAVSPLQAPYIQPLSRYTASASPVNDSLKWIHFGSYVSTTGSAPETKYEMSFKGANFIPTLTMMCHAEKDELYWSNNRTFIESGQGDELFFGQTTSSTGINGSTYTSTSGSFLIPSNKMVRENKFVTIKNTISSSFANYSASYQPQVFISQIGIYDEEKNLIGIAKLANPVRKTKELDYTFKLKLDM